MRGRGLADRESQVQLVGEDASLPGPLAEHGNEDGGPEPMAPSLRQKASLPLVGSGPS